MRLPSLKSLSLRARIQLVVFGTTTVLLLLLALDAWQMLNSRFQRQDHEFSVSQAQRLGDGVASQVDGISSSARDWGVWDATWQWMSDTNSHYAEENLQPANLANIPIHRLAILDTAGHLLRGIAVDPQSGYETRFPDSLLKYLVKLSQSGEKVKSSSILHGMIEVDGQFLALAVQPILPSNGQGTPRGLLAMARVLASESTYPDGSNLRLRNGKGLARSGVLVRILGPNLLRVELPLQNFLGSPMVVADIEMARPFYRQGQSTVSVILVLMGLFGFAFMFILVRFLDKVVISRLERLRENLVAIGQNPASGARVASMGADDLGKVADQINSTLDALESSRNYLTDAQRIARLGSWELDLGRMSARLSAEHQETAGLTPTRSAIEVQMEFEEYLARYVHPEDQERLRTWVQYAKDHAEEKIRGDLEYRTIGHDGDVRHLSAACRKRLDDGTVLFLVAQDITERKRMEDALLRGSLYDGLTGLPNRTLFHDRLVSSLSRRSEGMVGVALLDLDRFQKLNTALGREVGDAMLLGIAVRLVGSLPPGTTVARLGADDFAAIIEGDDLLELGRLAEAMKLAVATPISMEGKELTLTGSIGLASAHRGELQAEELIRRAESALFQARTRGGDVVAFFDEERSRTARERMALELELRRAVPHGELLVYYQPIVRLDDLSLAGFESLVRWKHPDRGLVSPGMFIPLAEETGLVVEIGRWVLRESCRKAALWAAANSEKPIFISVNVSAKQMVLEGLVDTVRSALDESGLDPRLLKLEITESALTDDPARAVQVLEQIRNLGVRFSLDDFGTGYSSLGYLHKFPVQTLKVDKSFVDLLGQERKVSITRAIVSLAHNLGMDVVAEGIEQPEQVVALKAMACEYGQGFLFARPLPETDADGYVQARN